jgi:hypothetical protein
VVVSQKLVLLGFTRTIHQESLQVSEGDTVTAAGDRCFFLPYSLVAFLLPTTVHCTLGLFLYADSLIVHEYSCDGLFSASARRCRCPDRPPAPWYCVYYAKRMPALRPRACRARVRSPVTGN